MRKGLHRNIIVTLAILIGTLSITPVMSAPQKDRWRRWEAHNTNSTATINHQSWQGFLKKYVKTNAHGVNLVAYDKVTDRSFTYLKKYIARMSKVKISEYNREEQLAFWINLYNALTVKIVLDHYPVESIKDINISPGFFTRGPWDANLLKIESAPITLNDIEHRILRPIWGDPRIHYAVNCASLGCPNLQKKAFTGDNVDKLLSKAAKEFINNPRGVTFRNNQLSVSKIYTWFKDDFGGTDESVIEHLKIYAREKLEKKLNRVSKISGSFYDWRLNGVQVPE